MKKKIVVEVEFGKLYDQKVEVIGYTGDAILTKDMYQLLEDVIPENWVKIEEGCIMPEPFQTLYLYTETHGVVRGCYYNNQWLSDNGLLLNPTHYMVFKEPNPPIK